MSTGRRVAGPVSTGVPADLQPIYPFSASFSPDGTRVALGTADDRVVLYDAHNAERLGELVVPRTHPPVSALKSPGLWDGAVFVHSWTRDGTALIVARWDSVVVLDIATNAVRYEVRGFSNHVTDSDTSDDGELVAAADYEGTVMTFSASDGRVVSTGHGRHVAFVPHSQIELQTDYFSRVTQVVDGRSGRPLQPRSRPAR